MTAPSPRRWLLLLPLVPWAWLAVRLAYNSMRQLVPDEAYYWVWSRRLSFGYLDHPPMVAWVIRAGTTLFGTSEFGVRSGAAVLALATIMVVVHITRRATADRKAALVTIAILFTSPLVATLGMVVTPDTPACFFSVCALACAVSVFPAEHDVRYRGPWWLAFGVCFGLALTSKYTSVLLGVAITLALLGSREGRREFARPWAWLGAVLAGAVFAPVVLWNRNHQWASFRFQLHHGTGSDAPVRPAVNVLLYVAGQAVVWTPVLFAFSIVVLIVFWRRFARLTVPDRTLLLAATVPLVFFAASSLRREPEPNWPMFAYLPLTVLVSKYVAETWGSKRVEWVKIGVIVAACGTVLLHVPELIRFIPQKAMRVVPGKWNDLFGWREMGRAIDEVREGSPVYATTYETASEASFYLTGRPPVWIMGSDRPNEYAFIPGRPDPASFPRVVFIRQGPRDPLRPPPSGPMPDELLKSFDTFRVIPWRGTALGRSLRTRQFIVATREGAMKRPVP